MTNNIEKLYELTGIEKYYLYTVKHLGKIHIAPLEGILENKHLFERNKKSKVKNTYINRVKKVYPPFTDTKQLELIKWLSKSKEFWLSIDFDEVKFTELKSWAVSVEWYTENKFFSCAKTEFPQALAGLVCKLWNDLTDEQREEIKRILE